MASAKLKEPAVTEGKRGDVAGNSSYGQIVKSSSIMGGAAGLNLLLGMVRVKFAAVLIGATGVGLNASFSALQNMIGTLAGLGLQSSAVREIAVALGRGDTAAAGRAVIALRRLCWLTGLAGMASMMLLSPWLSQLVFGKPDYMLDIAALGVAILLANISGGQMALIQGMRRIGDMARVNVTGAAIGTVCAIGFYWTLGLRGIIPTLLALAIAQLVLSWWYARRVPVPGAELPWSQTFREASAMVRLGVAMMISSLLSTAVSLATVSLITQQEGIPAAGFYSAAFALSGLFVGFVLQAMSADYYPRLTAVAHDKTQMVRLVNEQTEIGLLLALPGMLATLVLAPWVIRAFYSAEFMPAVELLQWFLLGCLGRVISWPLGFVMLALGQGRWYLFTETTFSLLHLGLIVAGLHWFGLEGVALAFFVMYAAYITGVYSVSRHLVAFRWGRVSRREIVLSVLVFVIGLAICKMLPALPAALLGLVLVAICSVMSLRGLATRLGKNHRLMQLANRLPGARFVIPTH